MRYLLAPLLAGVAVFALGGMLAFAGQSDPTDPPEEGEPPTPVVVMPTSLAPFGAVAGEVTRGPTCAGPAIQGRVCEEPAQATIDIRNQAGEVVAHFQNDPAGRFFVPLPPGVYIVEVSRPHVAQSVRELEPVKVTPQPLTITSGVVEQLMIRIDTGIR